MSTYNRLNWIEVVAIGDPFTNGLLLEAAITVTDLSFNILGEWTDIYGSEPGDIQDVLREFPHDADAFEDSPLIELCEKRWETERELLYNGGAEIVEVMQKADSVGAPLVCRHPWRTRRWIEADLSNVTDALGDVDIVAATLLWAQVVADDSVPIPAEPHRARDRIRTTMSIVQQHILRLKGPS